MSQDMANWYFLEGCLKIVCDQSHMNQTDPEYSLHSKNVPTNVDILLDSIEILSWKKIEWVELSKIH